MQEVTVEVHLPTPLMQYGLDADEIQRRVVEWLVMSLFSEGQISSGQAATLLGIPRTEFIALLRRRAGTAGREQGGAREEVASASWIHVVDMADRAAVDDLMNELDLGEAETIVLAREIGADWVLMDERKGRRKLTELGLNKLGTVGLLLKAQQGGVIPRLQPELERLRLEGFSLSQTVIDSVLHEANG